VVPNASEIQTMQSGYDLRLVNIVLQLIRVDAMVELTFEHIQEENSQQNEE
jgi:hypothetical protein